MTVSLLDVIFRIKKALGCDKCSDEVAQLLLARPRHRPSASQWTDLEKGNRIWSRKCIEFDKWKEILPPGRHRIASAKRKYICLLLTLSMCKILLGMFHIHPIIILLSVLLVLQESSPIFGAVFVPSTLSYTSFLHLPSSQAQATGFPSYGIFRSSPLSVGGHHRLPP